MAGKVPIPPARAMKISRMAPPVRAAQGGSYARTGKPLKLPRYRDVVDAATALIEAAGEKAEVSALARILNDVDQFPTPGGKILVPPLDTEYVSDLTNRLDRALGLVAKVAVDKARFHEVRPSAEDVAALRGLVGRLISYAKFIEELLRLPPVRRAEALRRLRGTYAVVCYLAEDTHFPDVGTFGSLTLPRGWYVYVGSAFMSGGVRGRVRYHAVLDKQHIRWNFHYVRPRMQIVEVWTTYDRVKRECQWAKLIYEKLGGAVLFPEFGAADCQKFAAPLCCQAHFCHFNERPTVEAFAKAVFDSNPDHAHIEVVDGSAVEPGRETCSPIDAQEENA